jgi:uncharacterized membrane protein YczE
MWSIFILSVSPNWDVQSNKRPESGTEIGHFSIIIIIILIWNSLVRVEKKKDKMFLIKSVLINIFLKIIFFLNIKTRDSNFKP